METLRSSSSLNRRDFNRKLLAVLMNDNPAQEATIARIVPHWEEVRLGRAALTFPELSEILTQLHDQGLAINPDNIGVTGPVKTPFSQQSFYDSIRQHFEDVQALEAQLYALQEEGKAEDGFLKTVFNIFSSKDPLEKIVHDVASFAQYCRANHITFDEISQQLAPGDKPRTTWDKIKEFRFLIAAAGGCALGLGGYATDINLLGHAPDIIQNIPGAFFKALPYFALPFISLSIFRAFSEKNITEEIGTFARFAGTMTLGILIGLGVTYGMADMLPALETPEALKRTSEAMAAAAGKAFNPSEWILHGIGLAAGFAAVYKKAKSSIASSFNQAVTHKDKLTAKFNKVADTFINRHTAPAIDKIGQWAGKSATTMDKLFNDYMNYLGVPAIFLMMTGIINDGGVGQLGNYGGFYLTITAGMATCGVALAGAAWLYGCNKKDFKEIAKTASTAFTISSSAATMPETKKSLQKMGVPDKIVNSVVPLGANFDMMGTSLYLGVTASSALVMFGLDPTIGQLAATMGLAVATAFGAPGAPASTIIFLDPVLAKAGLNTAQAQEIYKMILPTDRVFDMGQTALNVTGDMMVAKDTQTWEEGHGLKKLLNKFAGPR